MVSLLKAWWGDAATEDNDFRFDYLPRLTGDHGTYQTVLDMIDGKVKGYFLMGENPAVGSAGGRLQRHALANLDWLVVRDLNLIESAEFWRDSPGDLSRRAGHRSRSALRSSSCRPPRTWKRTAASPTPSGSCSGTTRRSSRPTTPAATCGSSTTSASGSGPGWAAPGDRDRPVLDLTWDYPEEGPLREPSAAAVLGEINGYAADG